MSAHIQTEHEMMKKNNINIILYLHKRIVEPHCHELGGSGGGGGGGGRSMMKEVPSSFDIKTRAILRQCRRAGTKSARSPFRSSSTPSLRSLK